MTKTKGILSILQITDSHILPNPGDTLLGIDTHYYFQQVLEFSFAQNQHYDLILLTGDLAQDPSDSSYQQILASLLNYHIPCVCLPGNHDDLALMQRILTAENTSCRKQVIFDHWQLICLNSQIANSAKGRLARQELEFLENCLTSRPDLNALIAVHHHCLETKSAWMDTMMIQNSGELFAMLTKFPQVKAITCGHIHQVMDRQHNGIRMLGTPSTCFQFKPESKDFSVDTTAPGYRVLTLQPDGQLETQIYRLPGQLVGLKFDSQGY